MIVKEKDILDYVEGFCAYPNSKMKTLREKGEAEGIPIILKETESLLNWILKNQNPQNILEIGTAIGYSISFMADILPDSKFTSIEKDPMMKIIAEKNISNLGFSERVEVIEGDGKDVLESLYEKFSQKKIQPFDLIFIDAAKSHYKQFWDLSSKMIEDGGIIICDNVLMKGMTASSRFDANNNYKTSIKKMREFLDYISNLDNVYTTILTVGDGISISTVKKGK